jgi:hypothetical protein
MMSRMMMISKRTPPPMYIVFALLSVNGCGKARDVPRLRALDTSAMRARGLEPPRALRPNGT